MDTTTNPPLLEGWYSLDPHDLRAAVIKGNPRLGETRDAKPA